MSNSLPQSILFCCDHNAVRSPMAEGIMKKLYGTDTYVQSVGVINDLEIDGFSIAVCEELVLNCLGIDQGVLMRWNDGEMIYHLSI